MTFTFLMAKLKEERLSIGEWCDTLISQLIDGSNSNELEVSFDGMKHCEDEHEIFTELFCESNEPSQKIDSCEPLAVFAELQGTSRMDELCKVLTKSCSRFNPKESEALFSGRIPSTTTFLSSACISLLAVVFCISLLIWRGKESAKCQKRRDDGERGKVDGDGVIGIEIVLSSRTAEDSIASHLPRDSGNTDLHNFPFRSILDYLGKGLGEEVAL